MSDVLTRTQDFRAAITRPPKEIVISLPSQQDMSGLTPSLTPEIGAIATLTVFPVSQLKISNAAQGVGQPTSPAALTKQSAAATKAEEIFKALSDALELSDIMVAEDEAIGIDPQTWTYAICSLFPIFFETAPPPPLMLPLQNGGVGAEWHEGGMNIELRFRGPYRVYAVVEDARGVIPAFHGSDPHLVQAGTALHELAARTSG